MKYVCFALLCWSVLPDLLAGEQELETPAVNVVFHGTLRHGVVAIGGETTGTTMTAEGVTWELEIPVELELFAETRDGQFVAVEGALQLRRGTEITERWTISVTKISEWTPRPGDQPGIQVEFRGKLRTGIMAIGAETTGTEISDGGFKWDLDLSGKQGLYEKADDWHKETVVACGQLKRLKGTERPDRYVILVDRLEQPKDQED